jgi:hypothetical protein
VTEVAPELEVEDEDEDEDELETDDEDELETDDETELETDDETEAGPPPFPEPPVELEVPVETEDEGAPPAELVLSEGPLSPGPVGTTLAAHAPASERHTEMTSRFELILSSLQSVAPHTQTRPRASAIYHVHTSPQACA